MRSSHKLLLGGLIVMLATMVAGIVGIRSVVNEFLGDEALADTPRFDAFDPALSPDLVDFDRLLIRSAWDVRIERGDQWQVDIAVPDEVESSVRVGVSGGRLVLDIARSDSRWWLNRSNRGNHVRVTMPSLTGIDVRGAANILLADFDSERLDIDIAGAANIESSGGRYTNLDLTIGGAGNVAFNRVRVTNARVSLAGASNVELLMDGGELVGELSGLGRLEYAGEVSREAVDVSGFSTVERARY